MGTNERFRDWPSKHVVEVGDAPDTVTYVCYSPAPKAQLAQEIWLVEKIDAAGSNRFPTDSVQGGELLANHAATDPSSLTFFARS